MIHAHPKSTSERVVFLALLMTAFLTTNARADLMSISIRNNLGLNTGANGDPSAAPLHAGSLATDGVEATLTQSGSQFAITDITINCYNVSTQDGSCSYVFAVDALQAQDFPAGTAYLSLDGSVTTSGSGVGLSSNFWATSGYVPNPYGSLVYDLYGSLGPLPTGSFAGTWSQDPRFNGPVSGVHMTLTITGLLTGDTIAMPGSMGVYIAPPSSIPEPSALALLLGMLAVLGLWRRRKTAAS